MAEPSPPDAPVTNTLIPSSGLSIVLDS